jgi:hypothetical protein
MRKGSCSLLQASGGPHEPHGNVQAKIDDRRGGCLREEGFNPSNSGCSCKPQTLTEQNAAYRLTTC